MIQTAIVYFAVASCMVYAVYRLYRIIRQPSHPCSKCCGCDKKKSRQA